MRLIALALATFALVGCARLAATGGGADGTAAAAEESFEVVGASMEPTLHCARPDRGCKGRQADLVVIRDEARIERREIVAFSVGAKAARMCGGGGRFVKRVVGVAGDRIEIRAGAVYRNGARVREPYADGPTDAGADPSVEVPPNHVYVLGDNRAASCDSRVWGPLAVRRVFGVGVAVDRGGRRLALP